MIDHILLDAWLLLYLALIIVFVKISERGSVWTDYLSRESTVSLRGIMAIGIVLHHMSEQVTCGFVFPKLVHVGYLFVSTFFFLSGYGLIVQYQKRGASYLKGFLRKRLLYLVIVYLLDVVLYTAFDFLIGKPHSVVEVLRSIYEGGIARNAWYMIVLIVFYFCFWIIFRLLQTRSLRVKITLVFICQILFIGVCQLTGRSGVWYLSNFGFSLGMLWACEKERIDSFAKRHYWLLGGVILGFVLFSAVPLGLERVFPGLGQDNWPRSVCRLISAPLSTAALILTLMKVRIQGRLWPFLGGISLEIYLLHGMAYTFYRSSIVYIENETLWVLCTVATAILISIPANRLNRLIADLCINSIKRTQE